MAREPRDVLADDRSDDASGVHGPEAERVFDAASAWLRALVVIVRRDAAGCVRDPVPGGVPGHRGRAISW